MKSLRFAFVFTAPLAFASLALSQTVTEPFDVALGSNSNWSTLQTQTTPGSGAVYSTTLSVGSGALNLAGSIGSGAAATTVTYHLPFATFGAYNQDWTLQMDVSNAITASSLLDGQRLEIGVYVAPVGGSPLQRVNVALTEAKYVGGATENLFYSNLTAANQLSPAAIGTSGKIEISYSATGKIITTRYFDSSWHDLGSYGISASLGGTSANSNWGTPSYFTGGVYVYGGTAASPFSVLTIASGNVFADNFSATNFSAVPEPSTYAALAGLCALGAAVWRRRSRS